MKSRQQLHQERKTLFFSRQLVRKDAEGYQRNDY